MLRYILYRLFLLPLTLLAIVFVNFVIINLAPGEPVYVSEVGVGGDASRRSSVSMVGPEDRYLQFREFFGLTLPILYNDWPSCSKRKIASELEMLRTKHAINESEEMSAKQYSELRVLMSDRARFCLPQLLSVAKDPQIPFETRKLAVYFFLRGATRFTNVGSKLSSQQRSENQQIAKNNLFLDSFRERPAKNLEELSQQIDILSNWYKEHPEGLSFVQDGPEYLRCAFFDTRLAKYLKRTLSLDFGVMRNDPNKTVISEVVSRLKISLTLSVLPMLGTVIICLVFGMLMAIYSRSLFDRGFNLLFLILWATPVFVVAPFLIERVALHHTYPFTDIPFPIRGFSSQAAVYSTLTSWQRVLDIARHITLPLLTIFLGSLAVQTRLSRAVFLECLGQDYVRTARAKGVRPMALYCRHVGMNAAIPIITSVAGSLGVIIGGSVIIETIFEIHGFGKFFYDAILNRDYNVMMFSSLMGSFLALVGYLVADLCYMALDPRVELGAKHEA